MPAYRLFGWYYAWCEPGWKRLIPRERRPLKDVAGSSMFWVVVLSLKFLYDATFLTHLPRSLYSLSTFILTLVSCCSSR